jgi:hypothetical protein
MIYLPVCLLLCPLFNLISRTSATTDYERHGGYVMVSYYQEPWTEKYTVSVTDYDSKGKRKDSHTETRYRHHPEQYWIEDSNGYIVNTDANDYNNLVKLFGNQTQEDGHHSDWDRVKWGFHYGGEGYLNNTRSSGRIVPCTTIHTYTNRIQASDVSLFHFKKISKEEVDRYGLFELPGVYEYYRCKYLLGMDNPQINEKLEKLNALYGNKQVSINILIFHDKPIEAGLAQESYWQGGNKNELNICIGLKNGKPDWSHVISWTPNELLKTKIKDFCRSQQELDLNAVIEYTRGELVAWSRKHFKDFEYVEVLTPPYMFWVNFGFCVLLFIVNQIWVILNENSYC